MSIHDELIAKTLMAKPTTDEEWLNIDWESRLITVPSTLTNIGVYNDKDTNRLYFRCPIEYGEFKIADFGVHVNYQNTGISTTKYDGDVYFVDDVESDGEYLTFSWLVGRHAYLEQGTTAFVVCCKVVDSDNNIVNELNTTLATLSVLEGLEVDANPEDYPDYLEELLKKVEVAETSAANAKSDAADAKTAAGNAEASAEDAQQAAESAVTTANEAKETADGIAGTAQNALDTAQAVAESAITGIKVNGENAPVTDHVAELTIEEGGDSKIVHGSFGEFGEIELTGAGMIILGGGNGVPTVFTFGGHSAARISGSQSDYNFESTSDGVKIYDNYGFTETLYTIIYV